jgi:hypothetical protein
VSRRSLNISTTRFSEDEYSVDFMIRWNIRFEFHWFHYFLYVLRIIQFGHRDSSGIDMEFHCAIKFLAYPNLSKLKKINTKIVCYVQIFTVGLIASPTISTDRKYLDGQSKVVPVAPEGLFSNFISRNSHTSSNSSKADFCLLKNIESISKENLRYANLLFQKPISG